jgi:transposase
MEQAWLADQLGSGRSIEAIARDVGRDPSTVGYWLRKHGLTSQHAARHAARGGLERDVLEALVQAGLSTRKIAAEVGRSQATVRHWLREFGLKTARARSPSNGEREAERVCPTHGADEVRRVRAEGSSALRAVPPATRRRPSQACEGDPGRRGGRSLRALRL